MKTYIFDTLKHYQKLSRSFKIETDLYNKSWQSFNEANIKEVLIFQKDGVLLTSTSGRVSKIDWQYIPTNNSIIINTKERAFMFHPAYIDNVLLVLQLDGTNRCVFLINEKAKSFFAPKTYPDILDYFVRQEKLIDNKQDDKYTAKKDYKDIQMQKLEQNKKDYLKRESTYVHNSLISRLWFNFCILILIGLLIVAGFIEFESSEINVYFFIGAIIWFVFSSYIYFEIGNHLKRKYRRINKAKDIIK